MPTAPFDPNAKQKFIIRDDTPRAEGEEYPDEPYYLLGFLTSLDRLEMLAYYETDRATNAAAAAKDALLDQGDEVDAPTEEERVDQGMRSIRAGWEMARRALRGWGNVGNGADGTPRKFAVERGQRYASRDAMHSIPLDHLLKLITEVGRMNAVNRDAVGKS